MERAPGGGGRGQQAVLQQVADLGRPASTASFTRLLVYAMVLCIALLAW